jgi:very-short-patch-repair endonuclease
MSELLVDPAIRTDDLQELIKRRIEGVRPKLLDLSRRNPLISTKLSAHSTAHIRVVDELPEVLFERLTQQKEMRFQPLPRLEGDPRDEQTRDFKNALSEARVTDEFWRSAQSQLDPSDEENLEAYQKAERQLKDRVRAELGMPPRQTSGEVSLKEHALINGISPSFELPLATETHEDGRHEDADIQTLLLPDDLERKLSGVITKCNTWIQETGIHVLYSAFGFLEWVEPGQTESSFAPLVMLSVQIEKRKSKGGVEFWVHNEGEEPETNSVLAEKLKQEFGIDLTPFDGGSLEAYFDVVSNLAPKNLKWKVRRQVVFGVFPSARLAMYHDLNPERIDNFNDPITTLLCGSSSQLVSAYGDEYDVDHPEIEKKVPNLVMDADSSQFSAIVEVSSGNNLALEGPPGTGKSQTIVNTIASMLSQGKKILFVAEKLAALDVVKSRLEAVELGEFVLALQAERANREQVIQSLRDRLDMEVGRRVKDLDEALKRFSETRSELKSYVDVLSRPVTLTGFSVYEVLGKSIATTEFADALPPAVRAAAVDNVQRFTKLEIENIKERGRSVTAAWQQLEAVSDNWQGTTASHLTRFDFDDICELAASGANALVIERTSSNELAQQGFTNHEISRLEQIEQLLSDLSTRPLNWTILSRLISCSDLSAIASHMAELRDADAENHAIQEHLSQTADSRALEALQRLKTFASEHRLESLNPTSVRAQLDDAKNRFEKSKRIVDVVKSFHRAVPDCETWSLRTIAQAKHVITSTPLKVLQMRALHLEHPEAQDVFRSLHKKSQELNGRKTRLESTIARNHVQLPTSKIAEHKRHIEALSLLSIFNNEHREAKKFYQNISKRPTFDKQVAARDLDDLIDFEDDLATFTSNRKFQTICRETCDLETDFDTLNAITDYYESVDRTFLGLDNRQLREFLNRADVDVLMSVPDLDTEAQIDKSIGYFLIEAEKASLEVEHLSGLLSDLEALAQILNPDRKTDLSTVSFLIDRLDKLLQQRQQLAEQSAAISQMLNMDLSAAFDVDAELQAAQKLTNLLECDVLLKALTENQAAGIVRKIRHFIDRKSESDQSLSQLSTRTGLFSFCNDDDRYGLIDKLQAASADRDGLIAHTHFASIVKDLNTRGLDWVVRELLKAGRPLNDLSEVLEAVIVRGLARWVNSEFGPVLSKFNGVKLDECRSRLATLDRQILQLQRRHLRASLHECGNYAPRGNGVGLKSEYTEMSLIEHELGKKKGHISARQLTKRAGRALLELKPCWMMSPLAIAQYLPKGELKFDLVIIDEASQMPPEDALGAIMRGAKVMIVGDTNQLPPSNFFRKMLGDDSISEDEAVLEESILEMANSVFRPARRLRWHYRSKHSSLINFSNHEVYNGDLIVFPSATESRADMGVKLVEVNGRYSSGVNVDEAKAMIDATIHFMKATPERSLGLVVMNQKQRDLLLEEWDHALAKEPEAARYVQRWTEKNDGLEQFFIKNLENVQGDERDVIFIGTVVAPEVPDGAVDGRAFGPINGLAGKRRLNVLFTRAKEQIITFASMNGSSIRADENSNAGVYMLKRWLDYSATGILHAGISTNKPTDSDFEDHVIKQIRAMGCEAIPQVGVAGYFIDIGIKHPAWPHGFIMGVECDGATYHSSKSARDRDRLRQEVLERLGWHLHRIWSTDWFNDPRRQAERLRAAITARIDELIGQCQPRSLSQNAGTRERDDDYEDEDDADVDDTDESDDEQLAITFVGAEGDAGTSRRSVDDVSAGQIVDAIVAVLKDCPHQSCTYASVPTRVLKNLGIVTRGNPRSKFKRRVNQCLTNLVYKEIVEKYKAKNERVRLV